MIATACSGRKGRCCCSQHCWCYLCATASAKPCQQIVKGSGTQVVGSGSRALQSLQHVRAQDKLQTYLHQDASHHSSLPESLLVKSYCTCVNSCFTCQVILYLCLIQALLENAKHATPQDDSRPAANGHALLSQSAKQQSGCCNWLTWLGDWLAAPARNTFDAAAVAGVQSDMSVPSL